LKKQGLPTQPVAAEPVHVTPQSTVQESVKTVQQPIQESIQPEAESSPMSSLACAISDALIKSGYGKELIDKISESVKVEGKESKITIAVEVRFGLIKEGL